MRQAFISTPQVQSNGRARLRSLIGVTGEWRKARLRIARVVIAACCRKRMLSIAVLLCLQSLAYAQSAYPTRPVRIVAPSATGSAADTLARSVAPLLAERLGQPVVVDTRPGGSSILGTDMVAKSAPDGHTLLIALPALAINASIRKTMPYDGLRDFAAITLAISQPNLLVVHPSLPVRSAKDLITLAKAHPGELSYASSGVGAASHLAVELFLLMTNTRMLHVPYKGPAPGLIDLIGGRVALMGASTIASLPHVRSGRLRPLGITTARRAPMLPDIATIAESGVPGYEAVSWFGLMAPAATPNEIITRLHKEIVAILSQEEIKERFNRDGTEVVASTPEHFAAFIRDERVKWAKVVAAAGIKAE
jgi:tripartite-type tricarboxylate transporter receptor subunit TctC